MAYPREVWVSHEEVNLSLYYEWDAQADIVATSSQSLSATGAIIDNQTVTAGDVVLCTAQGTPSQNGLYLVPASGAWTALSPQQPQVVMVLNGDTYQNTKWNLASANTYSQVALTYYDPTPVRSELYCQKLRIKATNQISKYRQPGATSPNLNVIPDGFNLSGTAFYQRKLEQWTPYLDVTKRFRLDWSLVNPRYDGLLIDQNENDDHAYRNCAIAGQEITREDNAVVEVALELEAEYQE